MRLRRFPAAAAAAAAAAAPGRAGRAGQGAEGAVGSRRPPLLGGLVPVPTYRDQPATLARDVSGSDLAGRPVCVPVLGTGRWTLLLFLSTDCQGCLPLWQALTDPVASGLSTDEAVVAITRGAANEQMGSLRALAPPGAEVVLSDPAWRDYRVQGAPFFALVDGRGARPAGRVLVASEGVAWGVEQIAAEVGRARERSGSDR